MTYSHPGGRLGGLAFVAVAGLAGQEGFEALDVGAADVCDTGDLGVVVGEIDGEVAQGGVDQRHAARAHAHADLGQVAAQGGNQVRGAGSQDGPMRSATGR